jgi:hypothetical protein
MAIDTTKVDVPAELRPVLAATAKNLLHHLYGPDGPPWGTSFDHLEELAVQISRALGSQLLDQALQRQADQPPASALSCPVCDQPGQPQDPEPRSLHTRTGLADWHEPAAYCTRCRRAFFPSVGESGAGSDAAQSSPAT